MSETLWLIDAFATWFMVGVIWLIQLVVYPSFRTIDAGEFRAAMLRHQALTGRVVILPMLVELIATLMLLVFQPLTILAWLGCGCVAVWGLSTVLVQVPIHIRLAERGPDEELFRRLVNGNWPRTIAWTVHGIICVLAQPRVTG